MSHAHAPPLPPCPGTARSSDFTDPLEAWEDPRPTLLSLLCWLPAQLAPFLPPGMRHTAEPHTGTMARYAGAQHAGLPTARLACLRCSRQALDLGA